MYDGMVLFDLALGMDDGTIIPYVGWNVGYCVLFTGLDPGGSYLAGKDLGVFGIISISSAYVHLRSPERICGMKESRVTTEQLQQHSYNSTATVPVQKSWEKSQIEPRSDKLEIWGKIRL